VGKLYTSELVSINQTEYTVEIWDDGFSTYKYETRVTNDGGIVEGLSCVDAIFSGKPLILTGEGFTLSYDGEGDKTFENPIRQSRAEATFSITEEADITIFQDMAVSDEGSYNMIIRKGAQLIWAGKILPDQNQWQRTPDGVFTMTVTAVDGLRLLENYNINENWFDSNGQILISELIFKMLSIGGMDAVWNNAGGKNTFFADALRIYETSLQSFTDERISKQKVSINAFYREFATFTKYSVRSNAYTGMLVNCKEAMERILISLNARIILTNGVFWIYNPIAYANYTAVSYNTYNTSGTVSATNSTFNHALPISTQNTVRPKWSSFPVITHQPANKEILISHDNYSSVTNLLDFNNPTTLFMQVGPLRTNTLERIQSEAIITIIMPPNPSGMPYFKSASLRIYNRTYSYDGTTYREYNHSDDVWEVVTAVSPGYKEIDLNEFYSNNGLQRKTYQFNYAHDYDIGTDYVYTIFKAEIVYKRQFFSPVVTSLPIYGVQRLYQKGDLTKQQLFSNTNNVKSSQIDKYELSFYDNFGPSSHGQIFVDNNAGSYVEATSWSVFPTASHTYVNDLVSVNGYASMSLYSNAVKSISGDWYDQGFYNLMRTLEFDESIWIWQGGVFNAQSEVFSGEWLKVASSFGLIVVGGEEDEQEGFDNDQFSQGLVALDTQIGILYDQNLSFNEYFQYSVFLKSQDDTTLLPDQDTTYSVGIRYDVANDTLAWNIQELGKTQSLTGGTHALDTTAELIICNSTEGNVIINLPDPATVKGRKYHFKKIASSHSVQLNGTIDTLPAFSFNGKDDCKVIMSDGVEYWLVAYYHK
jgi:hypothetical protein